MLQKLFKRISFLLKSTNEHGVHSPFVYSYLREGIYETKKNFKNYRKRRRVLQATIDYFQVQEIIGTPKFKVHSHSNVIKKPGVITYKKLHYIDDLKSYDDNKLQQLIRTIDSNTILYIHSPNHYKKSEENWLKLQAEDKFHVSIDFFIAGLVLTREGQRKEHFILRV